MAVVASGQDELVLGRASELGVALEIVGARWTLLIIEVLLRVGSCRFKDLTDRLDGISTNLLSERLRELEHSGLIQRRVTEPPGSVVTYDLTASGQALAPAIDALSKWARRPAGRAL